MAGVGFHVREDKKAFEEALKQMGLRMERPTSGAWKQMGEHMLRSIDRNFDHEGRPVKWQALRDGSAESGYLSRHEGKKSRTKAGRYTKAMAMHEAYHKVLTLSSRLRNSIAYAVSGRVLALGTNVVYARIHQLGGVVKAVRAGALRFRIGDQWVQKQSVKIPARPFLVLQEEDKPILAEIVADDIARGVKP